MSAQRKKDVLVMAREQGEHDREKTREAYPAPFPLYAHAIYWAAYRGEAEIARFGRLNWSKR